MSENMKTIALVMLLALIAVATYGFLRAQKPRRDVISILGEGRVKLEHDQKTRDEWRRYFESLG